MTTKVRPLNLTLYYVSVQPFIHPECVDAFVHSLIHKDHISFWY